MSATRWTSHTPLHVPRRAKESARKAGIHRRGSGIHAHPANAADELRRRMPRGWEVADEHLGDDLHQ